jgi:hypothetical protein
MLCGKLVCMSCLTKEAGVCVRCSHKRDEFMPKA